MFAIRSSTGLWAVLWNAVNSHRPSSRTATNVCTLSVCGRVHPRRSTAPRLTITATSGAGNRMSTITPYSRLPLRNRFHRASWQSTIFGRPQ